MHLQVCASFISRIVVVVRVFPDYEYTTTLIYLYMAPFGAVLTSPVLASQEPSRAWSPSSVFTKQDFDGPSSPIKLDVDVEYRGGADHGGGALIPCIMSSTVGTHRKVMDAANRVRNATDLFDARVQSAEESYARVQSTYKARDAALRAAARAAEVRKLDHTTAVASYTRGKEKMNEAESKQKISVFSKAGKRLTAAARFADQGTADARYGNDGQHRDLKVRKPTQSDRGKAWMGRASARHEAAKEQEAEAALSVEDRMKRLGLSEL